MASAGSLHDLHHPEVNVRPVPDSVAEFERRSQGKAGLAPDVSFIGYSFDADGPM